MGRSGDVISVAWHLAVDDTPGNRRSDGVSALTQRDPHGRRVPNWLATPVRQPVRYANRAQIPAYRALRVPELVPGAHDRVLANQFGTRTLHEVVSGERDLLMADITKSLNGMAQKELGIEVVDVRSLQPLDFETIARSVEHTSRAIIVHEAQRNYGPGAELAARLQEQLFYVMESPVLRVTGYDTPYPHSQEWEY